MNTIFKMALTLNIFLLLISCSTPQGKENTLISIKTTAGEIKIRLYDDTPIHRDNFIKLVSSGFYDGISFHRVIKDFMIQAGDPKTKGKISYPDSLNSYTIPAEFKSSHFHKKGALAAAREGNDVNPGMRSSGTQFYIVQGVKYSDDELNQAEQRVNSNIKQTLFNTLLKQTADSIRLSGKADYDAEAQQIASIKMFQYLTSHKDYKLSDEQRIAYKTVGGVPRLDGTYTVFGEVIEGLDIVDKIAAVQTDNADRPLNDVKILKMKIIKK